MPAAESQYRDVAVETHLGLRIAAPVFLFAMILETGTHWFGTWGPEANVGLACLLLFAPFALRWHWRPPSVEHAHTGIAFLLSLLVANNMAHVAVAGGANADIFMAFSMFATGAFVLSRAWLLPLLSVQLTAWLMIAGIRGQFLLMPISVTILALSIHAARRRAMDLARARQRELEESNAQLLTAQEALDCAGDAILWVASDGGLAYANEAASQLLGYSSDELSRMRIEDIEVSRPDTPSRPLLAANGDNFETVYRSKDGCRLPVEVRARTVQAEASSFRCLIARDLTPRRRVEEKLQRAQRVESLAVLAGGLAHDFNNLLTAMAGNAELARDRLAEHSAERAHLDNLLEATDRAELLTRQLLAYAGGSLVDQQKLDLGGEVQEIARLLQASLPKGVRLEIEDSGDVSTVLGDRAQLQQLVMNFVVNAGEAIGQAPGRVRVRTFARELSAEQASQLEPVLRRGGGRYVAFEISDDGAGMDVDTRVHIFDPFFTTKSHGRGLGLAAVFGIARSHGGGVEVESSVGAGSTFRVFLPAAGGVAARPGRAAQPALEGRGPVLVVDDEAAPREVAKLHLERFGFEVLTATDGVEALEVVRGNEEALRFVLLDLTMPGMGGHEVLRAIRRIRGDLPVILCSGYGTDPGRLTTAEAGPVGFLAKPYRRDELVRSVREVLGEDS